MVKVYKHQNKVLLKNNQVSTSDTCCCPDCALCENSITEDQRGEFCPAVHSWDNSSPPSILNKYVITANVQPTKICGNIPINVCGGVGYGTEDPPGKWPLFWVGGLGGWQAGDPIFGYSSSGPMGCDAYGFGDLSIKCDYITSYVEGGDLHTWLFQGVFGDGGTTMSGPYGGRSPGYITGSPIGFLSVSWSMNVHLKEVNKCKIAGLAGTGSLNYTYRTFNFGTVPENTPRVPGQAPWNGPGPDPFWGQMGYYVDDNCTGVTTAHVSIDLMAPANWNCGLST